MTWLHHRQLTRVISTTSVPTFIKPLTSSLVALTRRKKGDIRLSHLSAHLQTTFVEDFTPRLYELFGSLTAWEQPLGAVLQRLWKRVFPHEKGLDFQTGDGVVVLKLIEDRLSHCRKRFGERGLEVLEEITFNDLPKNDTAHRQWWCQWALSGDDNSCRPFYYSTYEEPDLEMEGSKLTVKGIFQSPLIAAILGTHMAWVCGIRDEDRLDRKPVGALVHSIQAVSHLLFFFYFRPINVVFLTGRRSVLSPGGKPGTGKAEEAAQRVFEGELGGPCGDPGRPHGSHHFNI
ncbi:hypothetical protein EDB83DRAFT_2234137 [Lactarius deliciosus]|nr:hypothetical protein EDB83DRAFT_2234137 [Lactarius deliciosus]